MTIESTIPDRYLKLIKKRLIKLESDLETITKESTRVEIRQTLEFCKREVYGVLSLVKTHNNREIPNDLSLIEVLHRLDAKFKTIESIVDISNKWEICAINGNRR